MKDWVRTATQVLWKFFAYSSFLLSVTKDHTYLILVILKMLKGRKEIMHILAWNLKYNESIMQQFISHAL